MSDPIHADRQTTVGAVVPVVAIVVAVLVVVLVVVFVVELLEYDFGARSTIIPIRNPYRN